MACWGVVIFSMKVASNKKYKRVDLVLSCFSWFDRRSIKKYMVSGMLLISFVKDDLIYISMRCLRNAPYLGLIRILWF